MTISIQRFLLIFIVISFSIFTSACGGLTNSDDPELNEVEVIDTSGSDSSTEAESEIEINSSENDGEFTIYWDIVTNDDYFVRVFINDRDSISGSLTLYDEFCDYRDSCHDNQYLNCEFQSNRELICEDFDDIQSTTDLNRLDNSLDLDLPENLHFIIEACDPFGFDCEDISIEVPFSE